MGVWAVSTFIIRLFILVALHHLCSWVGRSNWAVYGCHCSYSRSPGVSFSKISKLNAGDSDAKSGAEWAQRLANPWFTTCVCVCVCKWDMSHYKNVSNALNMPWTSHISIHMQQLCIVTINHFCSISTAYPPSANWRLLSRGTLKYGNIKIVL